MFVNDVITLTATFRDSAGTLITPTAVTFKVTKPDGTTETLSSLTNGSTGVYSKAYTVLSVGTYFWYATGTGSNAKSESTSFSVANMVP